MLQPVTLALVAASWSAPALKKCKGASWLVLVYSAYVNMQVLAWMSTTLGSGALADSLSTRVRVAYWGFILFVSCCCLLDRSVDKAASLIDPKRKQRKIHIPNQPTN